MSHHSKRGTPTMGGLVVIAATIVGYFTGTLTSGEHIQISALLVLFMMVGLGAVGFLDDFLKTRNQRSLGLGGWAKILGQVIVAVAFGLLALQFPNNHDITPASTAVSLFRDTRFDFVLLFGAIGGIIVYILWVAFLTTSTSNGVNVADGLDGLATGASILAIGSYIIIGFWQNNQYAYGLGLDPDVAYKAYYVRDPLDLAIVATALVGALVGFLWWNTSPAQIFLGDTGSLSIGGALAALGILSHTELLLVPIGGLFVIVTGSVILQRAYFKLSHGKRIFLMSPLHHHFELKGWAEVTVVVRFWIISGLLAGAGVGAFYLEWLSR
ncbi:phospho-N-acetylmuramoyl-pentapeptide-transferase [Naasia aerilata]|uniref:Phospho-N-acetylmuramoyl-pentapeptide-transferase n=1 Tax=Naasia aerilata TaxID=1162966 RepID=A0ABN6XTY2_9MICO|nr:phospho-N-acetylmuramoyl-pentapeptide-transferase [Naasia aerilata]